MRPSTAPRSEGYDSLYLGFNSPLMQQIRSEAYGEDIGQHSWVDADEVRADLARLELTSSSRVFDLGCGPCGPLTFALARTGCTGVGVEISAEALRAGRERAAWLGVEARLRAVRADLNEPLPFQSGSFDAAISLDVVLHIRDRLSLFREVARGLRPGGRFLFTDAGVLTGPISAEEVERRSAHGYTRFVPPGRNESLLESAGFKLIESEHRTGKVVRNAGGRLAAMQSHRAELEGMWGMAEFEQQNAYLQTVVELARRGALARVMYLAQAHNEPV